jgi:DNA-binding transcriptional LysR family regulator
MRHISLDRLRTLVTIADCGSFAEAARLLHLAPPTVSLHIADLESRIGATLLLRQRGGVAPSAAGETLIAHARRLLADAEQAVEDVRRQAQGLEGRVRLGASTNVIAHHLPKALARLGEQHPGIDVRISVLTSQEALTQLAEGTLDVGLVALPQSQMKNVSIEPWRKDPVMAFMPADWACPRQVTPEWIAARPLILNDSNTRLSRIASDWFAAGGQYPTPRIKLNYTEAIKRLVAAGYGATLLPQENAAEPEDARIVVRPLRPALSRELGLAFRTANADRPTEHVLDLLRALRPSNPKSPRPPKPPRSPR